MFRIAPADPALPAVRDRVLATIHAALRGGAGVAVREVGSTAVDGVIGKGDLDLLVLASPDRFDAVRAALDALFVRNPRQYASAIYQGYTLASGDPPGGLDVAIQLTVAGGPHDTFDAFLDRLRQDPALVEAYNALKRRWNGRSMDGYRAEKAAFIEAALARR